MSLSQRLTDLTRDPNDTINRESSMLADHLAKRGPLMYSMTK